MKHLLHFIVFIITISANAQSYIALDDANTTESISLYQDVYGRIGIGNTAPDATLHVKGCLGATSVVTSSFMGSGCINGNPDFFRAERYTVAGLPPVTTTHVEFVVNSQGHVGIGIAEPQTQLHIKSKTWNTTGDAFDNPVFAIADDDDELVAGIFNSGNGTTHGGLIAVTAANNDAPALLVANNVAGHYPFAVLGDNTAIFGFSEGSPYAQVDIRKNNTHDYVLNVSDAANENTYFTVNNSGKVSVGYTPTTGDHGMFSISGAWPTADLWAQASNPARIRMLNSSGILTHLITEGSGDMIIDAGASAGNDKLKIDGSVLIERAGATNGVSLDLRENNSNPDYNAQLRWLNTSGNVRHIITEDPNGNLLIDAGFGGGASNTVKIDGHELVNGGIELNQPDPGSGGWYNGLVFRNPADANVQQVICNANDDLIMNLNPFGFGSGKFKIQGGSVLIGDIAAPCTTGSCYSLYVEKGILAERYKCALSSDNVNWSDYVFDKKYKLMPIEDLERYVKKNKHLPNIPSAEEVYRDGIDLAEMNAKLLEKIEELTLYVIELRKDIDKIKKQ